MPIASHLPSLWFGFVVFITFGKYMTNIENPFILAMNNIEPKTHYASIMDSDIVAHDDVSRMEEYIADWKAKGSPHAWTLVEDVGGYQAWLDVGRNMQAIYCTVTGALEFGYGTITLNDVVMINKDDLETKHYLYQPMASKFNFPAI